jgi:DNA segregation ATPase FtsK/SpoIIIE, S-DNA-T family
MKFRLTLRRDPAEAKDLAVTVDGRATVADIATELWAADPARKGTEPPSNLSISVDEAFVGGGLSGQVLRPTDNLLESGLRPTVPWRCRPLWHGHPP